MTCEVIRDLLPLCADGVASDESRAAVEEHIRTCAACRALYESMCAPVEAQEPAKEPDYMDAVRQQKKENRRFILLTYGVTLGVLLLLVVGGKVKSLPQIRAWYLESLPITAEQMAEEMPQALLTRAEKELAKEIFSLPEVQDALANPSDDPMATLPEELYRELMIQAGFDPDSVKHGYADIMGRTVYLDWYNEEYRCILEFIDSDESGHADILRKVTSKRVPKVDENGFADTSNRAPIYTVEINVASIGLYPEDAEKNERSESVSTTCEKSVEKRDWLYFLKEG